MDTSQIPDISSPEARKPRYSLNHKSFLQDKAVPQSFQEEDKSYCNYRQEEHTSWPRDKNIQASKVQAAQILQGKMNQEGMDIEN